MKPKLIPIACALLLMSNTAGAQAPEAPSTGAQEQEAPTAKMTGQDMMGHKGGGMMGYRMRGRGMWVTACPCASYSFEWTLTATGLYRLRNSRTLMPKSSR